MKKISFISLILVFISVNIYSQDNTSELASYHLDEPDSVLFEEVDYQGKRALHLKKLRKYKRDQGADAAYLKDFNFKNGTIECDIASDIYTGIAFRVKNGETHECIYFRPFNSGTPKHDKTVQYVAKGSKYSWHYLRKNYPGKYESGADIQNNKWFHVKLVVKDTSVKVYVDDSKEPVLVVDDMKYGVSEGSVGLWTHDGYYANLKINSED